MASFEKYCVIAVFLLTWFRSYEMSGLSIIIPGNRQDCLYMEKRSGERINVEIQVSLQPRSQYCIF